MNGKDFDYYIAVASNQETPSGLVEYMVPEGTWAVAEDYRCEAWLPIVKKY
ncbi:hypothetical protein CLHUN_38450 [Ruminiclostridium hungatei]|uniref:Uncharacterized protein n=1 Tax=Ruminiclostridium hungatei TaxID=48256 RepID=A0A1V4SES0_RUMHU|nr:hypothetical protein CLHUN_38450 [Ruminiclostridium hungatei]